MSIIVRSRRVLVMAVAAGAVAACIPVAALAASASPGAHAQPATIKGCRLPGLEVWLGLNPDGAAGPYNYYPLEFTNIGSAHACRLQGFPNVYAVSSSGHRIGPAAAPFAPPVHAITLQPGHTAFTRLAVNIKGFVRGCHNAHGAGLTVTPQAGGLSQSIMSFSFPACTNKVFMRLTQFEAGVGIP
jgi:Protein of unknown function (DUF4232)